MATSPCSAAWTSTPILSPQVGRAQSWGPSSPGVSQPQETGLGDTPVLFPPQGGAWHV